MHSFVSSLQHGVNPLVALSRIGTIRPGAIPFSSHGPATLPLFQNDTYRVDLRCFQPFQSITLHHQHHLLHTRVLQGILLQGANKLHTHAMVTSQPFSTEEWMALTPSVVLHVQMYCPKP
jgi:hypothetical protein